LFELAEAEVEILGDGLEPGPGAFVAAFFFDLFGAAELFLCEDVGFLRAVAAADEFVGELGEVVGEFAL
jgi:hypothetical protein